jgi:hypothetical protein
MKKLTLNSPLMPRATVKEIHTVSFWRLSRAVRENTMSRERVESRINFILGNPTLTSKRLQEQFLKLRSLNRGRTDVRNTA